MPTLVLAMLAAIVSACALDGEPEAVTTADAFYATDHVVVIRLHLGGDALDALDADPFTYVRGDLEYAGVVYPDIGVRLKGSASFNELDEKPAFKLKLDKFVAGQRLLGLESLTLDNMVQDPSFVREWLSYQIFRAAGVNAPRAGFAEVYLDGQLLGLYANVESVDDVFLARNFADPSGPLYEGDYGDDLRAGSVDDFELDEGDDPGRALLRSLADAVDGEADTLFWAEDTPLDTFGFLAFSAVEAAIGHWDGYRRSHNYRVYLDPTAGTWSFIPWGVDQALHREVDAFAGSGRVTRKCLGRESCARSYVDAVHDIASLLESLDLGAELDRVEGVITDALARDPRAPHSRAASADRRDDIARYIAERPDVLRSQTGCFRGDDIPGVGVDGNMVRRPACPCDELSIDGERFSLCEYRLTWGGARDWCAALGLELASIDDQAQNDALWRAAQDRSPGAWHIGLNALDGDEFHWLDGTAPVFDGWAPGEPSSSDEACAEMRGDNGMWRDTGCGRWQPFVCR